MNADPMVAKLADVMAARRPPDPMTTPTPDLTTLLGFVELNIILIEDTKEIVKVRQLKMRQMPAYQAVFNDEGATIELFCERPKGWADTLTPESWEQIIIEGEKLNLSFLERHAARARARGEKIAPGAEERMQLLLAERLLPQLLTSLPKPDSAPRP